MTFPRWFRRAATTLLMAGPACRMLRQGLLRGLLVCWMLIGLTTFALPPAIAQISQIEEAPGQMVYQARQTIRDLNGLSWQVIAFKRTVPSGESSFDLRLVGFPGAVEVKHPHPLVLTTSMGQTSTAADVTRQIFTDESPAPNVGQYDLAEILPQLSETVPLQLSLSSTSGSEIVLNISPRVVQTWQAVANQS